MYLGQQISRRQRLAIPRMVPVLYPHGHRSGLGSAAGVAKGLSTAAPIAGTLTTFATSTAIGAWAGPAGAAVGAIVGIIAGLFAASAQRASDAKSENAAINQFLPAFDQSLQQLVQQANAGAYTGPQAAQIAQQILATYWSGIAPYQKYPGTADASHGGSNCGTVPSPNPCTGMVGGPPCNKSCTAGCCVGCQFLAPTIAQAVAVFQNPTGGKINACPVIGNKYGLTSRSGYTLTYAPPAGAAGAASGAVDSLVGGGSVAGIPLWVLLAGGGLAFLAFR